MKNKRITQLEVRDPWWSFLTWNRFSCRVGRHEWGRKLDSSSLICVHCGKAQTR